MSVSGWMDWVLFGVGRFKGEIKGKRAGTRVETRMEKPFSMKEASPVTLHRRHPHSFQRLHNLVFPIDIPKKKKKKKKKKLTSQIPPTPHPQTPPRMLRQRMQHMIQKPHSRPYPDLLLRTHLTGVVFGFL